MSILLSAYSGKAYLDNILSAADHTEASINFYRDIFGLREDVSVKLESHDGVWQFLPDPGYRILCGQQDWTGRDIHFNDILDLQIDGMIVATIVVRQLLHPFIPYTKIDLRGIHSLTIGKSGHCDIAVDVMRLISREHLTLEFSERGCVLHDTSRNGIYVNSIRSEKVQQLHFGDVINLFGMKIIWLGTVLALDMSYGAKINGQRLHVMGADEFFAHMAEAGYPAYYRPGTREFRRAPRNVIRIGTDPIAIEAAPAKTQEEKRTVLETVGPSLTMAIPMIIGSGMAILGSASAEQNSIFMYTGLVTAVSAAMIGSIWAFVNLKNGRKHAAQEEANRKGAYSAYLEAKDKDIQQKYDYNRQALRDMYPSAAACSRYADVRDSLKLWGRNVTQADFLYERLGNGTIPFQSEIRIPQRHFEVYRDPLEDGPAQIRKKYEMLTEVPVGVDLLAHQLIGVLGGSGKQNAYQIARLLITQIAANNSYLDVKIGLVYNQEKQIEKQTLDGVKWLPHVWSEDRKTRFVADNRADAADVFYELAQVIRQRAEEKETKAVQRPYYVLFVTDLSLLTGELISRYILNPEPRYGMTTVLLAGGYDELPNTCDFIIENDANYSGFYTVGTSALDYQHIDFDRIGNDEFEKFVKKLANIRVTETERSGELPASLTFLDMYHVHRLSELNVENRWAKNRAYESMKALIGETGGGAPCYLDAHEKYHGPHGLVAGTTGSGKSETLQTYILSLAVNFSPDDVGFFIIDYKGGGMANLFTKLPHMMGSISNLSGNQVHRAMISIKSENQRRQRIFNENGVNNINQYTKLYKNKETSVPIPHLFIIIDEFAELKREEPDFMQELISVAQVGRSLGVHLILSTQKPAGTVDDNIWSNAKFRLCLRVQDRQDSQDMLHKPDAAYITQTGRGYLQVGNDELYELFQTGWSGAPYEADEGQKSEIVQMLTMTGKTAMTGNRMKIVRQEEQKKKWIARLLTAIDRAQATAGVTAEETARSQEMTEIISETVFADLERQAVDYPKTEFNLRRLMDLIHLCGDKRVSGGSCAADRADEILRLSVQSGVKLPEQKKMSQLEAVVNYLAETAKKKNYTNNYMLWLPVLPTELYLDHLEGHEAVSYADGAWKPKNRWSLAAQIGLADDPVNQAQFPAEVNLGVNGGLAVIGSVASGKSIFVQTLVWSLVSRYDPGWLNLYLIDFSSHMLDAFAHAPQVGGIMNEDTPERIVKFFHMIGKIMEERKHLLKGGSYEQFIKKNKQVALPAIVIVIDQYGSFKEKADSAYTERLTRISRDGTSYGIYLVITASGFGGDGIERSIADNLRSSICLEMPDRFAYTDVLHTMKLDVLPEAGCRGRGLIPEGERVLEFQTAIAKEAKDDYDRIAVLDKICRDMAEHCEKPAARRIPEIPEKPVESAFMELPEVQEMIRDPRWFPIGYDKESAEIYSIPMAQTFCYTISGAHRTGKTNLLKLMVRIAAEKKGEIHIFDTTGALSAFAGQYGTKLIQTPQELTEALVEMAGKVRERSVSRKEAWAEGLDQETVFARQQQFTPIFWFIDNLNDFLNMVLYPAEDQPDLQGYLENITDKGVLHNIYFFSCVDPGENLPAGDLCDFMLRDHHGIHFGGALDQQNLFRFDFVPYLKQGKREQPGIGYLPTDSYEEEKRTEKVVVPLAGK